jgi:hypothetical protein
VSGESLAVDKALALLEARVAALQGGGGEGGAAAAGGDKHDKPGGFFACEKRIVVQQHLRGRLIGRGGVEVAKLEAESGARVDFKTDSNEVYLKASYTSSSLRPHTLSLARASTSKLTRMRSHSPPHTHLPLPFSPLPPPPLSPPLAPLLAPPVPPDSMCVGRGEVTYGGLLGYTGFFCFCFCFTLISWGAYG